MSDMKIVGMQELKKKLKKTKMTMKLCF